MLRYCIKIVFVEKVLILHFCASCCTPNTTSHLLMELLFSNVYKKTNEFVWICSKVMWLFSRLPQRGINSLAASLLLSLSSCSGVVLVSGASFCSDPLSVELCPHRLASGASRQWGSNGHRSAQQGTYIHRQVGLYRDSREVREKTLLFFLLELLAIIKKKKSV